MTRPGAWFSTVVSRPREAISVRTMAWMRSSLCSSMAPLDTTRRRFSGAVCWGERKNVQPTVISVFSGEEAPSRARQLLRQHQDQVYAHTSRLFAILMVVQWLAGILAAVWISPRTGVGTTSYTHLHVWLSIFLGGAIISLPVFLTLTHPTAALTRHTVAVCQMLMSALLIHLTGGRIETHFHVFGSLAFLAFYRDWKVLIPATLVVACDHALRGIYFPQSVFGVLTASSWRWVEHAGWVLFEDLILVKSCL